jgi:hypothetical protein
VSAISFQAIPILIDGHDTQGQLVLMDGQLVAVLARLDGDAHDAAMKSWWNLEAGFGPCQAIGDNIFQTLNDAEAWVRQKLAAHSSARAQSLTAVQ